MSRRRRTTQTVCAEPGCPDLCSGTFCDRHKPTPWANAHQRRPRTGSGWSEQRRHQEVLNQHGSICHVCGGAGADQVDHVVPVAEGGTEDRSNLRPIHGEPCHVEKTQREALRGRRIQG
jgi:5-methylcytosine-specific restriction protein A